MKVLTWNINGLRATTLSGNFCNKHVTYSQGGFQYKTETSKSKNKTLKFILEELDADIICFQEVKTPRDQLEESLAIVDGYTSYFSFSRKKSAYSGVATFCKNSCIPCRAEEGLTDVLNNMPSECEIVAHYGDTSEFTKEELKELDSEGRTIITQHEIENKDGNSQNRLLTIINVYCPYGGEEGERMDFKLNFYKLLKIRASSLIASGSRVLIVGDINTSHHLIDHCEGDSRDPKEFYENPGRTFLSRLLHPCSKDCTTNHEQMLTKALPDVEHEDRPNSDSPLFIDAFRFSHPHTHSAFTCWNTSIGARATNYGTRIDYLFTDVLLGSNFLMDCVILPDIHGSDHCPVKAQFDLHLRPSKQCPKIATKYWPEYFGGKQKTLGTFFVVKLSQDCDTESAKRPAQIDIEDKRQEKKLKLEPNVKEAGKVSKSQPRSILDFFQKDKSSPNRVGEPASSSSSTQTKENELVSKTSSKRNEESCSAWKMLLKGPAKAPLCKGHGEPCLLNTVKKAGPNFGKKFYVCCRPTGHTSNKDARCNHFEWSK